MSQQRDDADEGLPEAEAALLAQSLKPVTPDPALAARMKARILQGIAQGGEAAASTTTARAGASIRCTGAPASGRSRPLRMRCTFDALRLVVGIARETRSVGPGAA